jgi:hypothetical protein
MLDLVVVLIGAEGPTVRNRTVAYFLHYRGARFRAAVERSKVMSKNQHGDWKRHPVRLDVRTASCNDLQSSAARPDFIARFRPAFGETVGIHEPAIGETQPELTETNLHSSDLAHIP